MTRDWRPPLRLVLGTIGSNVLGRFFVDLGTRGPVASHLKRSVSGTS